jgi:tetratricopeptide (TPR) repeat protein/transcriptional regulator with XRE-family HTH domain
VAGTDALTFGGLLKRLRVDKGLTQEELAEAAKVSTRTVSDLERGINSSARRDTTRLLADALALTGSVRAQFEATARGRSGTKSGAAAAVTRTLPRDVASFTGRQQQLQELADALAVSGGVASIHAIGGMAGVGKTAFAVHVAHQLADRFPGGQIFLPLHGHTPGQQPVDPEDALGSLLLMAGFAPGQIAPGVEVRAGLWRDHLADKELLLILDDAASSEQVSPLLPGSGRNLVLITSRRHLSALDDATAISLDTLPPDEAAELLVRLTGRAGLSADDPAVRHIVALCGYLPLAIGMMARQLHHHPAWSLDDRVAELVEATGRLELMTTENLSVAAAFDLSYDELPADQQRLFRRLGLHPGTEIDSYAAAALDGIDLAAARNALEALYDRYLLSELTRGRYRLHDLIREHAYALAVRVDAGSVRDQAVERLLDFYQHSAALAAASLARLTRPGPPPAAPAGLPAIPGLADPALALAWVRAERSSLLACLDYADATGQYDRVVAFTAALSVLWRRDGPWAEALARHTAAVQAARTIGDSLGEANAFSSIGDVRRLTGDYPGAGQALRQALSIYRHLGNRLGEANALNYLGDVRRLTGDYPDAAQALDHALSIYRDIGDQPGEANALNNLGTLRRLTGDLGGAVQAQKQALQIFRDLGDRGGEANVLNYLADVQTLAGDYPDAAEALERALQLVRDQGNRFGQANTLNNLGNLRRLTGDLSGAVEAHEQALTIYRDLGNRLGQANALTYLGIIRRSAGDYPDAALALDEALQIFRDLGSPDSEAEVLNERGTLYRVAGELARAEECHQRALEIARGIPSTWDEGSALAGLGRCAKAAGDTRQARMLLGQARDIFQRMGVPEANEVLAELSALTSNGDAASSSCE